MSKEINNFLYLLSMDGNQEMVSVELCHWFTLMCALISLFILLSIDLLTLPRLLLAGLIRPHLRWFSKSVPQIGTFLQKHIRSHDILNGSNLIKFLEILKSNKTPNIFSTNGLKITFKP